MTLNLQSIDRNRIGKWMAGIAAGIAVLAGIAEFTGFSLKDFFFNNELPIPFDVKVLVYGEQGTNDFILQGEGKVFLDLPGDRRVAPINEIGVASFEQIPSQFINDSVTILIQHEKHYRSIKPDSLYCLKADAMYRIEVKLFDADKVYGQVLGSGNQKSLEGERRNDIKSATPVKNRIDHTVDIDKDLIKKNGTNDIAQKYRNSNKHEGNEILMNNICETDKEGIILKFNTINSLKIAKEFAIKLNECWLNKKNVSGDILIGSEAYPSAAEIKLGKEKGKNEVELFEFLKGKIVLRSELNAANALKPLLNNGSEVQIIIKEEDEVISQDRKLETQYFIQTQREIARLIFEVRQNNIKVPVLISIYEGELN